MAQQVERQALLQEAVGVDPAQIHQVDLLLPGLGALGVVALDEDEPVLIQRRQVADHRIREARVDPVLPGPLGVGTGAEVELIQDPPPPVGVVTQRALQHRVQPLAVDASGHALKAAAGPQRPGVRIRQERVLG